MSVVGSKDVRVVSGASGGDWVSRIADPSLKWYVYPAVDFRLRFYGNVTANNQTLYMCDDVFCIPVRFSGYLSWFDQSTNSVGGRVFPNHPEAWDHSNETSPNTSAPYNGGGILIAGFRGYWYGIHLTDNTNKVQVNILHRYTDGAVLIYNTGKDGTTSVNMTVRVSDPPSGLGYSVSTNGTRGSGYTDIAPGQYVLFYKGTAPSIDTANGLFSTSPIGSGKSQPYELYVNSFSNRGINVPRIYLGIKAPSDMEVGSSGRFLRIYRNALSWFGFAGSSSQRAPVNESNYIRDLYGYWLFIYDYDPYASAGTYAGGAVAWKLWSGWAEDDGGSVKFLVLSLYGTKHSTKWEPRYRTYSALIYDVDRDEEYLIAIGKPIASNVYCYGEAGLVTNPHTGSTALDLVQATAFKYIDANDNITTVTSQTTTCWQYFDNIYGYCNVYSDRIVCVEGVGIYTTDSNLAISNPKSAWGAARCSYATDKVGAGGIRVPSWGDKSWVQNAVYMVVVRHKEFPATATDTDLRNWFTSIQPRVLSQSEVNSIIGVLPGSVWLFGQSTDAVSITVPTSVAPGQQFSVQVSCPARPGKAVWVMVVDGSGRVVSSASGTLDSSGNATVTLTAPSTAGTYRVVAIVAGDRQLP